MKKSLILLFVFQIISMQTYAQLKNANIDLQEIRNYKNHLEVDLTDLFNGFSGATLIYKRNLSPKDAYAENELKLFRVTASVNNNYQQIFSSNLSQDGNSFFVSTSLGLEKQRIKGNVAFSYGLDVLLSYSSNNNNLFMDGVGLNESNSALYGAGLNPFFGIKYYISNRIHIGIESGVSFVYNYNTISQVDLRTSVPNVVNFRDGHSFNVRFNNLRFLTVGILI